ncbi:unnamed protein product [Acanthoscelides obtectus]|uniref:Thioredoxin domain-containing protein n=2 Tax=Acanthoscelides obtectus TaxID=200917 RepID=A0A9P0JJK2_ACAOB|nr:unnamed protein product [Acanthoscelides obtectus]CAK1634690.1 Protein disulfide-isomerase TMX3 [Acanthoscelides obtectus]
MIWSLPFLFLGLCMRTHSYEVLDLYQNFPEIRKNGGFWLVKFYAPWCGHCKRLEPVWNEVGEALSKSNIYVRKIDCSRFSSVANEFGIRGYPTIKFITSNAAFTFTGDRSKDEIINFAVRMAGPAIQEIVDPEILPKFLAVNKLFFMYIGDQKGPLWNSYKEVAKKMQPHGYFYSVNENLVKSHINVSDVPSILVYKDSKPLFFSGENLEKKKQVNASLFKWVNEERYPTFTKVTIGNINEIMHIKSIVLAIVDEKQLQNIGSEMEGIKNLLEDFAKEFRNKYHKYYQFGWIGSPDLANSIAMQTLPLPYIMVLNSSTYEYYVPEEDISDIDSRKIDAFLEKILSHSIPSYGGNSFFTRIRRGIFDAYVAFSEIWSTNPILGMVLFGLPMTVLSFVIYTICCVDFDAGEQEEEEDDDDEDDHDKKD